MTITPAPHEALLAAYGVRPHEAVEALVERPIWPSDTRQGASAASLYWGVPLSTPFGDVLLNVFHAPDILPAAGETELVADLTVPGTGVRGSFIVNGREYALSYGSRTITLSRYRSRTGDTVETCAHSTTMYGGLTKAAARKISEWWAATGSAAITPLMVAARDLADASRAAHRAREKRDKLAAELEAAEQVAIAERAALQDALNLFARLSAESVVETPEA